MRPLLMARWALVCDIAVTIQFHYPTLAKQSIISQCFDGEVILPYYQPTNVYFVIVLNY